MLGIPYTWSGYSTLTMNLSPCYICSRISFLMLMLYGHVKPLVNES